jgi:hypothetical protein
MPDTGVGADDQNAADLGRRYLIRFEEDTLRSRPLWIRVIIEFVGTYLLVQWPRERESSTITPAEGRSAGPPQ